MKSKKLTIIFLSIFLSCIKIHAYSQEPLDTFIGYVMMPNAKMDGLTEYWLKYATDEFGVSISGKKSTEILNKLYQKFYDGTPVYGKLSIYKTYIFFEPAWGSSLFMSGAVDMNIPIKDIREIGTGEKSFQTTTIFHTEHGLVEFLPNKHLWNIFKDFAHDIIDLVEAQSSFRKH